jgi:hypothetical protein
MHGRREAKIQKAKHALYMKKLTKAALRLQAVYRGHRGRLSYHLQSAALRQHQRHLSEAASKIQNAWRAHRSKKLMGNLKRENFLRMITDARSWVEYFDAEQNKPFFFNATTGDSTWDLPSRGYTRPDGKLVLFNGDVVDDPSDVVTKEENDDDGEEEHEVEYEKFEGYDEEYAMPAAVTTTTTVSNDALNETTTTTTSNSYMAASEKIDDSSTKELEQQYATDAYTMEGDTYQNEAEYDSNYYGGEEDQYYNNDEGWTGLGAWVQYTDEESGAPYWYNHDTGETTWDDPTGGGGGGGDGYDYSEYTYEEGHHSYEEGQQQQQQ